MTVATRLPPDVLELAPVPLRELRTGGRIFSYRQAGDGDAIVLLHGIGSSSGSWVGVMHRLQARFRPVAWDAPGYGGSSALAREAPRACDYAEALAVFMDGLGCEKPILVGHSLGALMAASFAATHPQRVRGLVLANPAHGYGGAGPDLRRQKLDERLAQMATLGPAGLAEQRAPALLSPRAGPDALATVQAGMRSLHPEGYAQASRMLAEGRLIEDAAGYPGPVLVMGSSADTVTPEKGSRLVAQACPGAEYRTLGEVGHASYVEAPEAFAAALSAFAERALRS